MNEFWLEAYQTFFKGRKILLGISGSIAAYKAIELTRLLKKCGAEVKVILTDSAEHFVTPLTLETVSENPVATSLWAAPSSTASSAASSAAGSTGATSTINHIDLARWADLVLIAPATANTIAELAHGQAANLLTTEVLATHAPVFIAPAMNPTMYAHPATQANLKKIEQWGYTILSPEGGVAACGDEGVGRMMEPATLIEHVASAFSEKSKQKTLLISLGPTRSNLDPVRYFTNRSSGKMGAALAFAASKKGYNVEVIAGPTSVPLPRLAKVTRVLTTDQMAGTVFDAFPHCDIFFSTAAVLDLEFASYFENKVKKDKIKNQIAFTPTVDILKNIGEMKKKNQFILGFAAETENFIANAQKKLKAKNCDAVFVNPVTQNENGFESDLNAGFLVKAKSSKQFATQSKHELANAILKALNLD